MMIYCMMIKIQKIIISALNSEVNVFIKVTLGYISFVELLNSLHIFCMQNKVIAIIGKINIKFMFS